MNPCDCRHQKEKCVRVIFYIEKIFFWTILMYIQISKKNFLLLFIVFTERPRVFNVVWCKSVENLSHLIRVNSRLWIRINPDQFFNPDESEVGIIRIDSDSFGLRTSHGFINIGSLDRKLFLYWLGWVQISSGTDLGMNRYKSDWFRISFNPKLLPRVSASL